MTIRAKLLNPDNCELTIRNVHSIFDKGTSLLLEAIRDKPISASVNNMPSIECDSFYLTKANVYKLDIII